METFRLLLLMYASNTLDYSKQQNRPTVGIERKVLSMNDWESVKVLQALCGRMDVFGDLCRRLK